MLMLISSWLSQERLRRVTDLSLTSMRVGNSRLPRVQRLAQKTSVVIRLNIEANYTDAQRKSEIAKA
jgi:hypothetical protein